MKYNSQSFHPLIKLLPHSKHTKYDLINVRNSFPMTQLYRDPSSVTRIGWRARKSHWKLCKNQSETRHRTHWISFIHYTDDSRKSVQWTFLSTILFTTDRGAIVFFWKANFTFRIAKLAPLHLNCRYTTLCRGIQWKIPPVTCIFLVDTLG